MSAYIPPNKRDTPKPSYSNQQPYRRQRYEVVEEERQAASKKKNEQEQERFTKCELTENNFPAIGAPISKMSVWGGTKSFATLAAEWNEKEKLDESKKIIQEKDESGTSAKHRQNIPLPRFQNVRRFRENNDNSERVENTNKEESEWTLVDRKRHRKEKTFEERIQQLEQKAEQQEKDDSVWNNEAPNEHETCWEDRY